MISMVKTKSWQPIWWDESHGSAWDRVKEAMKRDWEQTKHDLKLPNGHELNQGVVDTLKQATGSEPIPAADGPNPPKIIGSWDEAETPIGYGYSAHNHYGTEHPIWNEGIEQRLRSEWESDALGVIQRPWPEVKPLVKRGYEYEHRA
jgi:hypothetical protein